MEGRRGRKGEEEKNREEIMNGCTAEAKRIF